MTSPTHASSPLSPSRLAWSGVPVLAALVAGACTTTNPIPISTGDKVYDRFPQSGELRVATFQAVRGKSIAYQAVGEVQPDPVAAANGTSFIYETVFTKFCLADPENCVTGDRLFSWHLSADSGGGVVLHQTDITGEDLVFDGFRLANGTMTAGDSLTNTVQGTEILTTYQGEEPCPTQYWLGDEIPNCVRIDLDDGGAATGFNGTIWAAIQFGIVAFDLEAQPTRWELRDYDYEP